MDTCSEGENTQIFEFQESGKVPYLARTGIFVRTSDMSALNRRAILYVHHYWPKIEPIKGGVFKLSSKTCFINENIDR